MAQHEAVELRFGKLEGSRLLDRVLRRDHEERRRQVVRGVADRHAALLHRLEQRRLHLRACAVDLVGKQEVREDRAFVDAEFARLLLEDLAADDVARQEVDRELDACEPEVDRLRHALHEQRLRDARHAFEQEVAAGEERDQHALDDDVLADDGARDLGADVIDERRVARGGRGQRGHVQRASSARNFSMSGLILSVFTPAARILPLRSMTMVVGSRWRATP